jgi:hypothetical protein
LVAELNLVTPYADVLAAGMLATPLVAIEVPLALTPVIVPLYVSVCKAVFAFSREVCTALAKSVLGIPVEGLL